MIKVDFNMSRVDLEINLQSTHLDAYRSTGYTRVI
jgi:hypothetical protein